MNNLMKVIYQNLEIIDVFFELGEWSPVHTNFTIYIKRAAYLCLDPLLFNGRNLRVSLEERIRVNFRSHKSNYSTSRVKGRSQLYTFNISSNSFTLLYF
jgi:hypothetical protein